MSRMSDVMIEIENVEFTPSSVPYDPTDMLNLNFKYLNECVAALAGEEKDKKEKDKEGNKDKEPVYLKWWPYKDTTAPTKGKTLCLSRGNNYYWISRVRDQQRSV